MTDDASEGRGPDGAAAQGAPRRRAGDVVPDDATRVAIVDDHELIRQGLRRAFERAGDFVVVGEAGSVATGRDLVARERPDVLVTDVRLPDGSGIDLARAVRSVAPDMGIVVLTMYAGDEHLLGALEAGASAFVNKDAPSDDVVAAARHAVVAPRSFSAADLAGAMQRRLSTPPGPSLSPRETEVLHLLADGLSAGQIGRRLFISESTIKTHIGKIYDKLGATNRAQAVMKAVRLGLVTPDPDREAT
ncbi:response regulator transcription factor [Aquipuribacter nitratireducens]|uniref:Response regulator transcription factor n=1 Tax=Aquipuribacter nitratireducens TaxID=650104 RepID=A0ABW0GRT0_9MICO